MNQDITEQIEVSLSIGMDTVVGSEVEYDADGVASYSGGVRLADLVADRIAERLIEQARRDVDMATIRRRIDLAVDEAVTEKLTSIMDREIVPTNEYGRPVGEPRTLSEEVVKKAEAWFTSYPRDSYSRDKGTNAQRLINEAVGKALEREVKAQIEAAKAEAFAKIKGAAATIFAEQFAKAQP